MNVRRILFLLGIGLIFITNKLYCQDSIKKAFGFSIRYIFNYNYKIEHNSVTFSIEHNNHNFYIGPEYSHILQPISMDVFNYRINTIGLNLGYRYFFNENIKELRLFSQFNFSIYQEKYQVLQLGPPFVTEQKNIIIENTGTLGLDYNLYKNFHLSCGLGIGSTGGFFLLIDSFIPCSYIGLEYKF